MKKTVTHFILLLMCTILVSCNAAGSPTPTAGVPAIIPAGTGITWKTTTAVPGSQDVYTADEVAASIVDKNNESPAPLAPEQTADVSAPVLSEATAAPDEDVMLDLEELLKKGVKHGDVFVSQSFEQTELAGSNKIKSVILVTDESRNVLWSKEFIAEVSEQEPISEAFTRKDILYLQVEDDLHAYSIYTGESVFVAEGIGKNIRYAFGIYDNLYIGGYGPFVTAVSSIGEVLWRIDAEYEGTELETVVSIAYEDELVKAVLLDTKHEQYLMTCKLDGSYLIEKMQELKETEVPKDAHGIRYENEALGFAFIIPASWEGYYRVVEIDGGIDFMFVGKSEGVGDEYMFTISPEPHKAVAAGTDISLREIGVAKRRPIYFFINAKPETQESGILQEVYKEDYEKLTSMASDYELIIKSFEALGEEMVREPNAASGRSEPLTR